MGDDASTYAFGKPNGLATSSAVGWPDATTNAVSFIPDVPTLLVQNANDEYLNREPIDEFYEAFQVEKGDTQM